MAEPTPFTVTCHGWSASNWLAHALQMHPDVTCTHSARNVLADDTNQHVGANFRRSIREFHAGYPRRAEIPLDVLDAEIRSHGQTSLYGSVHLLRLRDLPVQHERHGAPSSTRVVVDLVRNPIDLVWSGYGQFRDLFRFDLNELHHTLGRVLDQAREFVLDLGHERDLLLGDVDNLAWLGACAVLESLRRDRDLVATVAALEWVRWGGVVRMEEVTTTPAVLADLVDRLSEGRLGAPDDWLEQVYGLGEVNRHRTSGGRVSPADRYAGLAPWQREVLDHFLALHGIVESYEDLGYELGFVGGPTA